MTRPRCALLLFLFCFGTGVAVAAGWAHEESDLAPDPAVHWGVLPNGLRHAVLPNAEPQGRISLRLIVQAGSMHENDDERGLAHFVEHMAFRSTRNHSGGNLVNTLQRLGVGFGPENTAFTTHDYTIYHLDLPDDKTATLREALLVFREYADGILFLPDEIERERGVVLNEMAMRNTPEARVSEANLGFILPGARQTERSPIGLESLIRTFTPAQFHAFYDAWYRPERMIVTMVGSVDPAVAAGLIEETLAPLAARGPARPEPPRLGRTPATTAEARVFNEPGIVGLALSFQHAVSVQETPGVYEDRVRELHSGLAHHMLQQRLTKLAQRRGTSFIAPRVEQNAGFTGWRVYSLILPSKLLAWRLVILEAEQELRRALEHGFTADELREAKKYFATHYEQSERMAGTRHSAALATQLAVCIAQHKVFTSPAIVRATIQPALDRATPEDCHHAFREVWGAAPPKLFIAANSSLNITDRDLTDAFLYSRRVEVLPRAELQTAVFAYTDFGQPGRLVANQYHEATDARLTRYANGVRFNFKRTDFETDAVLVSLRVGTGRISQPPDRPGLDLLANYALLSGGLGRHTNTELNEILNGRVISLGFNVESDALAFTLHCAPRELLLGLQTLTAMLTDAAYRPEAMRNARANFGALVEWVANTPGGPIFALAPRVLTGGDLRFGVPTMEILGQRSLPELRAWLEPQFRGGPLEFSIVGDVDFATAEAAVAQTLGALPDRFVMLKAPQGQLSVPPPPAEPIITPVDTKLRQCALAYYWPMPDLRDVATERRCRLLADLIEERLRQRVREELGASYALAAKFEQYEGFPELSYFETYIEIDPLRADEVDRLVRREIASLRRDGLTPDEFERVRQPFLARRSADLRDNGYWGYTVLREAQLKPARLAAALDRESDTAAITAVEVQALADRYLDPDRMFVFRTTPVRNPGAMYPPASD